MQAKWDKLPVSERPLDGTWVNVSSLHSKNDKQCSNDANITVRKQHGVFQIWDSKYHAPLEEQSSPRVERVDEASTPGLLKRKPKVAKYKTIKKGTPEYHKLEFNEEMIPIVTSVITEYTNDPKNFKIFFDWEHKVTSYFKKKRPKLKETEQRWYVFDTPGNTQSPFLYGALEILHLALLTFRNAGVNHYATTSGMFRSRKRESEEVPKAKGGTLEHHVNAVLSLLTSNTLPICYTVEIEHIQNNELQVYKKKYLDSFSTTLDEFKVLTEFFMLHITSRRVLPGNLQTIKESLEKLKQQLEGE
eukprot:1751511-Rhodomonas_salina.1